MGKKYKNPPVVEALCEIFFTGSKWDGTIPGMFFDKIKADYSVKKELKQIGVGLSISPEAQQFIPMGGSTRIQFLKPDGSQLIQIEKDLIVINQLRPYPRFEDWSPVVDKMLKLYCELAQPAGIRQLGIRYINRIVIPAHTFKMEDYFKLYPEIPDSLGAMHGRFMMRLEIPAKHKGHQLIITFATTQSDSPETSAEMLDLYNVYPMPPQLLAVHDLDKYKKEAHENIELAFENSITQKSRDLFEEE